MESLARALFKVSVDLYKNGGLSPVVDTAGIPFQQHLQQTVELTVKRIKIYIPVKSKHWMCY